MLRVSLSFFKLFAVAGLVVVFARLVVVLARFLTLGG